LANSRGKEAVAHICYKNLSGTSTSMESDIIVQGFQSNLAMHGIKYAYLIGDGDSSVQKKLLESRPYKDTQMQKIECTNHLLRNYCSPLRDLCTKRFSSAGQSVTVEFRNLLENNIKHLRVDIECAVDFRQKENATDLEKLKSLKNDITNSVKHVFGDHTECASYFCKRKQEHNWIPAMKSCGLYQVGFDTLRKFENTNIFEI
jgi:hypothetical protein